MLSGPTNDYLFPKCENQVYDEDQDIEMEQFFEEEGSVDEQEPLIVPHIKDINVKAISAFAESFLTCQSNFFNFRCSDLSLEELESAFNVRIQMLENISDSEQYGLILRQAEQILLKIEANPPSDLIGKDISLMKENFTSCFYKMPPGPGFLMQMEVNYLKQLSCVPQNVICQNNAGIKYEKPSISTESLISIFCKLGYEHIMFSREVANFNGKDEICDVVMVGVEYKQYEYITHALLHGFIMNLGEKGKSIYDEDIKKINHYFTTQKNALKLGYASACSILVENLNDKERARRLNEQGFQVCTILTYPQLREKI